MRLTLGGVRALLLVLPGVLMLSDAPGGAPRLQTPGSLPSPPSLPGAVAGRDPAAPKAGTAIIRGRVLSAEGAPLRRVQLTLRQAGAPPSEAPTVATDEQGRYEMTGVPAGRYTLNAAKTGYLTLSYGQRRPLDAPGPLEVAEGLVLERIDFVLPRGSVIVAHITDDLGEPLAGIFVQAEYYGFANGQRRLASAGSARTDDLGEARLAGIPPGSYIISADANFGGSSAVHGVSDSGRRYTLTYSPGTLLVSQAQRMMVGVGQETSVVFPLVVARAARVSGVVRNSEGGPPVGRVLLGVTRRITSGSTGSSSALQPDGSFSIPNLLPGDYTLTVSPGTTQGGAQATAREYAAFPIAVAGVDQTGLVITTRKGATLQGQIVFDAGTAAPDVRPAALQIFASMLEGASLSGGQFTPNDDWTFSAADVAGTGMLRLRGPVNGWSLKAVMLDGKDVTDTPIEFADNRAFKDLQLVLTQKRTEVSGGVSDSRGAAATDYVVVIFSEERSQWTAQSRFIAIGRPDQQGRFKVAGLPPGRYLAVAVDYLPNGQERDPELLDRLEPAANRLTLAEGESRALSLKLTAY